MNNWIETDNYVGDKGTALINLNSGIIVERVEHLDAETHKTDGFSTKIWSLNDGNRYLVGKADLYDTVKEVYKKTDKDIDEIARSLFGIDHTLTSSSL